MHNLLIMMASILTEEQLIERLENAIKEHKLLNSESTKTALHIACHLWELKGATQLEKDGALGLIKRLDGLSEAQQLSERMSGKLS